MLLTLYVVRAVLGAVSQSSTVDEQAHVKVGFLQWTAPRLPQPPEGGVLSQRWQTWPVALATRGTEAPTTGPSFMTQQCGDVRCALALARSMNVLIGALLGWLVYVWSSRLFGARGGLLSLALYTLCPSFLGHGALITPDVTTALLFFASTLALSRVLASVTPTRVLASCACVAALVLTKLSFFTIVPIALGLAAFELTAQAPLRVRLLGTREVTTPRAKLGVYGALAAAHALVALLAVWLAYDFPPDGDLGARARDAILEGTRAAGLTTTLAAALLEQAARMAVLPEAFVEGLSRGLHITHDRWTFAAGRYSLDGFWWYFPYAFLIKTPLPTLLLMLSAPVAYLVWRKRVPAAAPQPQVRELAALATLVVVYGAVCMASGLNIGHRHLLPIYPALFVLCGAHALTWMPRPRVQHAVTAALVAGVVGSSIAIQPHYLAFFNTLVGGPKQGYRQLVDSSLDWGQDLPALRRYLDREVPQPERDRVYLSYFGTDKPEAYGIHALDLPDLAGHTPHGAPPELRGGTYVISASMLSGQFLKFSGPWTPRFEQLYRATRAEHERADLAQRGPMYAQKVALQLWHLRFARLCAQLRERPPDAWIGYSMLVFRLSDADVARAL